MDNILKGLNKQQKEAVLHDKGPLLIIAGAGTGKTSVITRRIAYLLSKEKVSQDEILALTFTDKAATEMEERVDLFVPYGYTDIWISTFHSFGDRVLRDNALRLGLDPDFKVLTRPEAAVFFREHLFKFDLSYYRPLANPNKFIEAIIIYFSRLKDEDISIDDYSDFIKRLEKKASALNDEILKEDIIRHRELFECFRKYQDFLVQESKIDFGNQFYLALKLLRERPAVLDYYRKQFKYILVDEFQDTNFAQFELIKLLTAGKKNITVVADDDQCVVRGSLIETTKGRKKIESIKRGDLVLTAVGKSHIGISRVKNVFKRKKKARLLTFQTESGNKITVTSEHKMFCYVPVRPVGKRSKIYYVYLMWRKDLGWRLGVTNDLAVRLKLERSADKVLGLRAFKTEQEARYLETYSSLKYGIPTVCFMKRKGLFVVDKVLRKLYQELDTEERVKRLCKDLDVNLNFHHYCLDAVTRGNKVRIKINVYLCYRKYISKIRKNKILKNPSILHRLLLETSDKETVEKLRESGFNLKRAKKGYRLNYCSSDLKNIEDVAYKIKEFTGGILEYKFNLGRLNTQNLPALIMPASNVLLGHYLPIKKGNSIIYDRIVSIKEENKRKTVYDLEIERTHNFIANGVVVHNCIYHFRGAAYSNIMNFIDTYPKAKQITLIKNYRSTQTILDSAYQLIQYNNPDRFEVKSDINKKLIAETKKGKKIKYINFDRVSSEADFIASEIEEKVNPVRSKSPKATAASSMLISNGVKNKECEYSDFAILVRSNNNADPFLRSLNMRNIPWRFSGNQGLYSKEEVRICISFLKLMANTEDSLSLYHLLSSEIYQADILDLSVLMHYAKRRNISLFSVLRFKLTDSQLENIPENTRSIIDKFILDVENYLTLSKTLSTGRLLYMFLTQTGYIKSLTKNPSLANEEKIRNVAKLFDIVRNYETLSREDRVIYFIQHLSLLIDVGDDPATVEPDLDIPAVQVLTVHKAKGLEFDVVFMVSLVQGRFPWPKRRGVIELPDELIKDMLPSGDFHIQEERRLFYVGMTRAKKELIFTSSLDYGGKKTRKVSRFVLEALGIKSDTSYKTKKVSSEEAIKRNAPQVEAKFYPQGVSLSDDAILNLTYYKIDDYKSCPLKYKYVHVLRVPIMQHHTVLYGKAMHDAVLRYYQSKMNNIAISESDLIYAFDSSFKTEGFLSVEHIEKRKDAGYNALKQFFKQEEKGKRLPTYMEKEFSFIIENNKINGRWDRVDIAKDKTIIIDFKTSAVKKQKDADKKAKESLQLSIYALAYKHINGILPAAVELHFLESGLVGGAVKDEGDLVDTIKIIKEVSCGIRSRDFAARPQYLSCTYCAYNQICPSVLMRGAK